MSMLVLNGSPRGEQSNTLKIARGLPRCRSSNLEFPSGKEYATNNRIEPDTQKNLSEPLYPPEAFVEMVNTSWCISDSHRSYSHPKLSDGR